MRSTDSEYQCVAGHKASRSKAETQAQGRDVVLQHSSTLRGEKEEGEVCVWFGTATLAFRPCGQKYVDS